MEHLVKTLLSLFLVFAMGFSVVGCKYSSYTTEKVYDADAQQYDEENRVQINSASAEKKSDDLPQLDFEAVSDNSEQEKSLPVAGTGDAKLKAPQVEYDPAADATLSAPKPTRSSKKSNSEKNVGDTQKADDGKASGKKRSTAKDGSAEKGNGKDGKKAGQSGGAKRSSSEKKVYEDYGEFPEIPKDVRHVAVVGKNATTVAAIASKGAILASDKDFLENKEVKAVLGKKLRGAKALWDKNGKLKSLPELTKLDIQLVYVDEGSDNLTKNQVKKLLKAGIIVYELPDMNTVSEIKTAIDIVGKTFKKGGDREAGDRADKLLSYYQKTLNGLIEKCGGVVAGGYDYEQSKNVESSLPSIYTLYISDWDKTAVYKDINGFVESRYGVAISHLGSNWSPLSYLLSAAGVVDNAAKGRYSYLDGHKAFVWQFNQNKVPANYSNWARFDSSKQDYRIVATDGFTESLLWSSDDRCGLGSKQFPRILVKTQEMKKLMLDDARCSNGLYHPYPQVTSGSGAKVSVIGFYANGVLCDACVGTSGKAFESSLNDGKAVEYYEVTVNPCGLFNSWTDGSIESILEAEWAYDIYYGSEENIRQSVDNFYKTFYDYRLSDNEIDAILNGPKK